MDNENIEIQIAKQTIGLLKQYADAKNQEEKDSLLSQLSSVNPGAHIVLTKKNYDPLDLAAKMEKAIQLDQYRPKNMSIVQLAISDDLAHVNGDFDTFDIKLSKMIKNKEDPKKIRDCFIGGTANIYVLAKQFSADWIRRLKKHKELADAARNAKEDTVVKAYNELFNALAKDFCEEYKCHIHAKVIIDWATSDVKPKDGWDNTSGYHQAAHGLDLPENVSEEEKTKILEEFHKNPVKYPGAYRESLVRINITNIMNKHPEPVDFFYSMISIFAHEMHHALDYQQTREGALGSQIEQADSKIYVNPTESVDAYLASATEISSHEIQYELFNQLKSVSF